MALVAIIVGVFILGMITGAVCYYYSGLASSYDIEMRKRMTSFELRLARLVDNVDEGLSYLRKKFT